MQTGHLAFRVSIRDYRAAALGADIGAQLAVFESADAISLDPFTRLSATSTQTLRRVLAALAGDIRAEGSIRDSALALAAEHLARWRLAFRLNLGESLSAFAGGLTTSLNAAGLDAPVTAREAGIAAQSEVRETLAAVGRTLKESYNAIERLITTEAALRTRNEREVHGKLARFREVVERACEVHMEAARAIAKEVERFGIEAIKRMRPRIEPVGDALDRIEGRVETAEGQLAVPWGIDRIEDEIREALKRVKATEQRIEIATDAIELAIAALEGVAGRRGFTVLERITMKVREFDTPMQNRMDQAALNIQRIKR